MTYHICELPEGFMVYTIKEPDRMTVWNDLVGEEHLLYGTRAEAESVVNVLMGMEYEWAIAQDVDAMQEPMEIPA